MALKIYVEILKKLLLTEIFDEIHHIGISFGVVGALLLLSTQLCTQPSQITFERFSVDQGLSNAEVYCILEDSQGFLWIGTADGLNRYDGYNFTIYRHDPLDSTSISDNSVYSLCEDHDGNLWIGTMHGGLNMLDPARQKFICYEHDVNSPKSIGYGWITCIDEDRSSNLWITTNQEGLNRFDRIHGEFVHYRYNPDDPTTLSSDDLAFIKEDSTGVFWIGSWSGQLNRFYAREKRCVRYKSTHGDLYPISNFGVLAVEDDRQGHLWFGSRAGLYAYDKRNETFEKFPIRPHYSPRKETRLAVTALHLDRRGTLWIGTWYEWLLSMNIYKPHPANVTRYNYGLRESEPEGIGSHHISAICEDRAGNIWVGTWNGLYKASRNRSRFLHYQHDARNSHSLSDDLVRTTAVGRNGMVWIGTETGGLNRFDPARNSFTAYKYERTKPTSISWNTIQQICEDKSGVLWVGTYGNGLNRFDPQSQRFLRIKGNPKDPHGLNSAYVISTLEDRDGTHWVLTQNGLSRFDANTLSFAQYGDLETRRYTSLVQDRTGILWVAAQDDGVFRIDVRNDSIKRYRHEPHNSPSLSSYQVMTIYEDRSGILWFGTQDGGLNRLNKEADTFTSYTDKDGLSNNNIEGIQEDQHGTLWLSTQKGLSRFDPLHKTFKNYYTDDGLPTNRFHGPGAQLQSGKIIFGTFDHGFIMFHPDSITDNEHIPSIVLTRFKKFDQAVNFDRPISDVREITLSYSENFFSFEFAALDFTSPGENRYAYRLEGFDRDWIQAGARRYASYTNLDPGEYIFRVRGSNNDGVWNEEGVAVKVVIVPPFWRTRWFLGLSLIGIVASFGGTIRYIEMRRVKRKLVRLEQERALEHERARISKDMHDELGASLTRISLLSEVAKENVQNPNDSKTQIEKISWAARQVVEKLDEIVWAVNPKNDTLESLVAYITEYASSYFESTPIACRFDMPESIPSYPLTAELRHNIFLTVKEALNNILKHSHGTQVNLRFNVSARSFELLIEDDGRGFIPDQISRFSNGLLNMRKRITDTGARFSLSSSPGQGTKLTIKMGSD